MTTSKAILFRASAAALLLAIGILVMQSNISAGDFATPEACATLGGEFQRDTGYNAWRGRCHIVASADVCRARRGDGTVRPDGLVDCALPLDADDVQAQCVAAGGAWGRHTPEARLDYCHIEQHVTDCRSRGGRWVPQGMLGVPGCVIASKDGGKMCSGRSDCEIACVYGGPQLPAGTQVTGECARDNSPFGCRTFVEGGRVVQGLCVD